MRGATLCWLQPNSLADPVSGHRIGGSRVQRRPGGVCLDVIADAEIQRDFAADSPAVLQKRAQHLQIVFRARVADALDKRLRDAEAIRLNRREPGKTDQRSGNIGAVQRTKAVVAAAVQLPLQNVDRDIAKVDPGLERVRAASVGEVVLQLVLIFDAVDDRERRLAEVREAGDVYRCVAPPAELLFAKSTGCRAN